MDTLPVLTYRSLGSQIVEVDLDMSLHEISPSGSILGGQS